jgi:serine/threonine protein phosphatase 1
MRTIAIGDIHGCARALDVLLAALALTPRDELIFLGDYVDRGPDSRGVLDRLIQLNLGRQAIFLRGNHEVMMMAGLEGVDSLRFWLQHGGQAALYSYGPSAVVNDIPEHHWHFLRTTCIDAFETDHHLFVHANLDPDLPLAEQTLEWMQWTPLSPKQHRPHCSGKTMICGHTQQASGYPLQLDHALCIDTRAYAPNGWLTALDVDSGHYWQSNQKGEVREGKLEV